MIKIAYFGTPVLPKEGAVRKLVFFTKSEAEPSVISTSSGNTKYSKDAFGIKFIYEGSVHAIDNPVPLPEDGTLYVDHKGSLFIADAKNPVKDKKEIGFYDHLLKEFFQDLEGGKER